MPTGSFTKTFVFPGYAFANANNASQTYDHPNTYEVSLPAGKAGTLTTRTSDTVGQITVASGHGITSSDTVDVYWSGGRRYGVDVTATGATTIDIALGAGDVLPAASTAVVVTKQVQVNTMIDGDRVVIFGVFLRSTDTAGKGHIDFQDVGSATIRQYDLTEVDNAATGMDVVYSGSAAAAQLTGNPITKSLASNGSSTAAATLYILVGEDSTP